MAVGANIRKVQVQGYQNSTLRAAGACEYSVIRARQVLIPGGVGGETGATQDISRLRRQVLVDFEFHTVSSAGKSMEPSRTNSAA